MYTELENDDFEEKYKEKRKMLKCYAINFTEKFLKGELKDGNFYNILIVYTN